MQMMVVLTVGVWDHQPGTVERQALAGWLAFVDVLLLHAPSYLSSVLHQAPTTARRPHGGASDSLAAPFVRWSPRRLAPAYQR